MVKKTQAFLISNKSNIKYLSNFSGSAGFMLLLKKKKYLFTDFRYIERAKAQIKKDVEIIDNTKMWKNPEILKKNWQKILKKHQISILGVEEATLAVSLYKKFKKISKINKKNIKFIDISGKIENLREIKSKKEIELITKSQRINEKIFTLIKKIIQSRPSNIREIDLVWQIKKLAHENKAEDVAFDPIIAFGKHSAIPHHLPGNTKLKKGDLVLIDMGVKYKGYCSDMTKIIFTKPPTAKQAEIYNLVLKAQTNAIKNIKSGISGQKVDKFARDIIENAGYGENYGHAGGHGIGLDIHEQPSLSENYIKKLKSNSIITIEPGIYLEGKFGIRIEDMVLVTKTGSQNLTKINKNI